MELRPDNDSDWAWPHVKSADSYSDWLVVLTFDLDLDPFFVVLAYLRNCPFLCLDMTCFYLDHDVKTAQFLFPALLKFLMCLEYPQPYEWTV